MKTKRLWIEWSPPDFDLLDGIKEKFFEEIVPWTFTPIQFGSDEFENHSIYMKVLGLWVVVFYERNMTPKDFWYFSGSGNGVQIWRTLESFDVWVEMQSDLASKRYMGYFEDYHDIDQTQHCAPAPISPELMEFLIGEGIAKYCYYEEDESS